MSGTDKTIEKEDTRAGREQPLLDVLLKRRVLSRNSLISGIDCTILFLFIGVFGLPSDIFTPVEPEYKIRLRHFKIVLAMAV